MADREVGRCPHCGAGPAEPCDFEGVQPCTVTDLDGSRRRTVHAARYALTLPTDERAAFWEAAIDLYMSERGFSDACA